MRDPHLADVVQVRPEPHRCLLHPIEAQRAGHRDGVLGHPLAMAVGVMIGWTSIDLTPFADHAEEGPLELLLLPGNVDQLDPGLESREEPVGVVEEGQAAWFRPRH